MDNNDRKKEIENLKREASYYKTQSIINLGLSLGWTILASDALVSCVREQNVIFGALAGIEYILGGNDFLRGIDYYRDARDKSLNLTRMKR